MPLSKLSAEQVEKLSALIAQVGATFPDCDYRAWARNWCTGKDCRSGSALHAAAIAASAIVRLAAPGAHCDAAWAVARAAVGSLLWPEDADWLAGWADQKIRAWRELKLV